MCKAGWTTWLEKQRVPPTYVVLLSQEGYVSTGRNWLAGPAMKFSSPLFMCPSMARAKSVVL